MLDLTCLVNRQRETVIDEEISGSSFHGMNVLGMIEMPGRAVATLLFRSVPMQRLGIRVAFRGK